MGGGGGGKRRRVNMFRKCSFMLLLCAFPCPIYLSIYLSVCLSVCLSIYLYSATNKDAVGSWVGEGRGVRLSRKFS